MQRTRSTGYIMVRSPSDPKRRSAASRPDWSRPLPRPLVIPTVLQLTTLADVRALIERQLPSDRHDVPAWRYVRKKLDEAARGGKAMDLAVALQIALHLEGVEYRPK